MTELEMFTRRFVCCADILGFSQKFLSLNTKEKVETYKDIIEALKSACHAFQNYTGTQPAFSSPRTNFHWFSDFFILFSNDIPATDLSIPGAFDAIESEVTNFLHCVKILFLHFLYLGFPSRGSIDFGEFYFNQDENIFIGDALIRAVTQSNQHEWAGISLTGDCIEEISRFPKTIKFFVPYGVPKKSGEKDYCKVIDWPADPSIRSKPQNYLQERFTKFSPNLSAKAKVKLENTQIFMKSRLQT